MYQTGDVRKQAQAAKTAAIELSLLKSDVKAKILLAMAEGILAEKETILTANAQDMEHGK